MKNIHQAILKCLTSREPVTHSQLRMYVNAKGFKIGSRGLRLLIDRLKRIGGHLIISNGKGLKLAQSRKEFEKYLNYKTAYLKAISKDIRIAKRNFNRTIKPQIF